MKHLKLFFALFAMLALGAGNAWAETSSITFREKYNANTQVDDTPIAITEGITATFTKGKSTATQYYTSGSAIRWYGGGGLNITSTIGNITAITITYTQTANSVSTDVGSYTLNSKTGSWSGNASSIQFTQSGTSGHCRISKIEVTYTPSSGGGGENPGEGEEPETPGSQSTATLIVGENGGVTWTNGSKTANATVGDVVFTALGSGSNDSKYYSSDKSWRFYTANTSGVKITTPEGSKIVSVIIKWKTGQPNTPTNWSKSGTSSPTTFTPNSGINTNEVSFTRNSSANFLAQEITVNYETSSSGSGTEEPVPSLTTDQFSWSATTATATLPNTFDNPPTLTNTESLAVSFSSSKGEVATIDANGNVTLVGKGETIISATAGDDETYKKTTVSYTLTVKPAPLAPIAGGVIDILNQDWTDVTGTNYTEVAAKTAENEGHSNAQYVAQCAGDKSSIQLRSNNNNSGVVSTISGGIVKRVEVEWQNETAAGRILQVYGSNTAYEAATDLYSDDKKGELLGEITMGGDETVVDYSQWTGDYKYIGLRSKSGAMYLTTITITWLPINSKVTIDDAIQHGSVSVTGATDLNAVAAGTELTLSNTPATNYKLAAYDVYKTGEESTKVTETYGKFIMPEFDVTISATFELAKTLTDIEITTTDVQKTFWQGETFNSTGLKVTAHFNGAEDEDVTDKVTVTGSTATASTQTVTVSFTEGTVTKTATYTITVKAIPNSKETAYTVADAFDIIDKLGEPEGIYITGTISQVDSYNSTYKSITYWISADGTTTKQLQVYSGKGLESADFSDKTDLSVGDQVIVCGNLKKFSGTYEFDKNNYLASHTPTTKDPAGLAYATTSYTANVGEAFTTPELTNPHNLVVTYSTSDASKATVDANTGAVTIVAAGVVTITAATTGDATHDAGSASYNITITDPSLAVATLPFYFDGKKADIEGTAGMTQEGIDSDYNAAPYLKFNTAGDWAIVQFDSEPGEFSFLLKQNGQNAGTFTVYESANGEDYTPIWSGGDLGGNGQSATIEPTLSATARYVKFEYTTKGASTNYGLGSISIAKPDNRAEAGLAWNPATVSLTVGDAFTPPTLINPHSVSGITYKSSNEDVATVSTDGVIALVEDAVGTATITATFADGDATYKPATATCTITVNEYIETLDGEWELVTDASKLQAGMEIIIASVEVDGKYYTMSKASDNGNNRTAVESTISGEKLNPALGTSVLTLVDAGNGTFALQAGNGKYLYAASSTSNHLKEKDKIDVNGQWTITIADSKATIKAEASSNRNWIRYNNSSNMFSCYASGQKDIALYAKKPAHTRTTSAGRYGTICLPGNIVKCLGATLYEVAGREGDKVIFDEVTTPEAGMPYIFLAHNAEVLFYCGDQTAAAGNHNSLYGTFTVLQNTELEGKYMVQNNKIVKCNPANSGVAENRAYFEGSELDVLGKPGAQMPGRRRITMGTESENEATGTEDVVAPEGQTLKLIENGQLIIIRNGEKFNSQGIKF